MQTSFLRMEAARERLGYTRAQLTALLQAQGKRLTRQAMEKWAENGIPSAHVDEIANILGVSVDWIKSNRNAPDWYVKDMVLRSLVRGVEEDLSQLDSNLTASQWVDFYVAALTHHLAFMHQSQRKLAFLALPDDFLVPRVWAISNRRNFFLEIPNIEAMARRAHVWPKCAKMGAIVSRWLGSRERTKIPVADSPSTNDSKIWNSYIRNLHRGVEGYRKAVSDDGRRNTSQGAVWNLLHNDIPGEPNLRGSAVIPVIAASFWAAWQVEILGPFYSRISTALEATLLEHFRGREFTTRDLCVHLMKRRGVQITLRNNKRSAIHSLREPWLGGISESTVNRRLKVIAEEGKIPLSYDDRRCAWAMASRDSV